MATLDNKLCVVKCLVESPPLPKVFRAEEVIDFTREFQAKLACAGPVQVIRVAASRAAVKALENGPQSPNPEVRAAVAVALGNTRSRAAIPVLTQMYADPDGRVQNDVCAAFATLTHYQWCDGGGTVTEIQARWREWWRSHASQLTLYGLDQCPEFGTSLPVVK